MAQYPGRPEFEANADRAREGAETLLATSLAAEAAIERHRTEIAEGHPKRSWVAALVDRIRSTLSGGEGR